MRMSTNQILESLKKEKINTWFDLGIFIDRFRETKPLPSTRFEGSFEEFKEYLSDGSLAFITFLCSVDGVSIEIDKYARIFQKLIPGIKIHYLAGEICSESEEILEKHVIRKEFPEIAGFDDWPLYHDFFFTKLERGSKKYNKLIKQFWDEVLVIVEKLGNYIEKNSIRILYLINVNSNPGNVSLALALALLSEYMGLPVINNNHDFYWEGGNRRIDILEKGLKEGPRDFFFTNSDLGEIFSLIEILYPWESRSWINVNINRGQSDHLIRTNGHNPANVAEIGTAVDTVRYVNISKRKKINAFYQFEKVLSRYSNTLISYSVADVIKNKLVSSREPRPILIGSKTKPIDKFLAENIIFLQPTRIIARKRIELGFKLIKKIFNNIHFVDRLKSTPNLKLTLLVTGPIASGHYDYFQQLIRRFSELLNVIDSNLRNRVYLAFLFSEIDKEDFKKRFAEPIGISDLYNIASLVLLPSKTEGRGLPIIEATACGTPILCTRYFPIHVYSEVIGEHLPESERLKVIEFDGKKITSKHASKIIERVLFPHKFTNDITHNKKAVQNRYSLEALNYNIYKILRILYRQISPNEKLFEFSKNAIKKYKEKTYFFNEDLKTILKNENRQYLPGYGKLAFMMNIKSLIDPSAFRQEEQQIRGYLHHYAKSLLEEEGKIKYPLEKRADYYNAIDNIFYYREGEVKIRHDHSFSYRHRNKNYYPYQDFTHQELTGLINLLYFEIIRPEYSKKIDESSHFFTDWDLALAQMTSSAEIEIDDRKFLIRKLQENIPIALFPGEFIKYELEFFALQPIRSRLNLDIQKELNDEILKQHKKHLANLYLFVQKKMIGKSYGINEVIEFIEKGNEQELKLLYKHDILKIIETDQLCEGIHFCQLGEKALKALLEVHNKNGFIISCRPDAAVMTDIVDIDKFHIGKASNPLTANIMGLSVGNGYIQFVPAGMRSSLTYPAPVQTSKDFNLAIKGKLFENLLNTYSEKQLFEILRKDALEKSSPTQYVLENLLTENIDQKDIYYEYVSGLYKDKMPWNGVYAKVNISSSNKKWIFRTINTKTKPKRVTEFINKFNKEYKVKAQIAWNGGYILNPELVGKLGLPESYIGSPLGLLISDENILCPPLFNKAALLIYKDGSIEIKKVNCKYGIIIGIKNHSIVLNEENYNLENPGQKIIYYDLTYKKEDIISKNRVIVRLAGNTVKEIIHPNEDSKTIKIIPVGLTISFPVDKFPAEFNEIEMKLNIQIMGLQNVLHAIEAGPLLISEGKISINMEDEGWKTLNSIKTQAARLDFTDMRGPKIAVGIDNKSNLSVLVINGRIRESVGATHNDMAEILLNLGNKWAMGFDPGGSSTLVVHNKQLNISPYNSEYEKNIYSLPPEPRAVSNAIIGYTE